MISKFKGIRRNLAFTTDSGTESTELNILPRRNNYFTLLSETSDSEDFSSRPPIVKKPQKKTKYQSVPRPSSTQRNPQEPKGSRN